MKDMGKCHLLQIFKTKLIYIDLIVLMTIAGPSIHAQKPFSIRVNEFLVDTTIVYIPAINLQKYPSAAFDGTNYLIVWQDDRSSTSYDIYGARVNKLGIVLDSGGIAISTAPFDQRYPCIAFDGTNYLVVWEDYCRTSWTSDIYGAKLNQSGIVIDSFAVSIQPGDQISPTLASGLDNQLLITYSGWTHFINTHPANTMRIWGKFYPFVGVEETARRFTPNALRLLEVYPNPFNRTTDIRLSMVHSVPSQGDENPRLSDGTKCIELKIYDVNGRLVRRFDYPSIRLSDQITWQGEDDFGKKLPAGVYFCCLESDNFVTTSKIIKLR
jgi:hypothetical protein